MRALFAVCLASTALVIAALSYVAGTVFWPSGNGLVSVESMDYTNEYKAEGFKIVCTHRGNRDDFRADGSDIGVGDILVRRCEVKPL